MLRSFVCSKNEIGLLWFDNAAILSPPTPSNKEGALVDSEVGINWAAQFGQNKTTTERFTSIVLHLSTK